MNDLGFHLVLFSIVGLAIVAINAIFAEPDDRKALHTLPKRLMVFFAGCGIVAALLLLIEHTVASVR